MAELITREQRKVMLANGARSTRGEDIDPVPVVKLFTALGSATWLLTELDPEDQDVAFGLCDLGLGFPEPGHVRISEITELRDRFMVERDLYFAPDKALSAYAEEARVRGAIVA